MISLKEKVSEIMLENVSLATQKRVQEKLAKVTKEVISEDLKIEFKKAVKKVMLEESYKIFQEDLKKVFKQDVDTVFQEQVNAVMKEEVTRALQQKLAAQSEPRIALEESLSDVKIKITNFILNKLTVLQNEPDEKLKIELESVKGKIIKYELEEKSLPTLYGILSSNIIYKNLLTEKKAIEEKLKHEDYTPYCKPSLLPKITMRTTTAAEIATPVSASTHQNSK